jgi:hypothetical protein
MLHSKDLADQLKRCADGQTSIENFEEWFAQNSWDVHRQRDGDLTDTVFQIEYLFSALNDGRLTAPEILGQFAKIASGIHPPEQGSVVADRNQSHSGLAKDAITERGVHVD